MVGSIVRLDTAARDIVIVIGEMDIGDVFVGADEHCTGISFGPHFVTSYLGVADPALFNALRNRYSVLFPERLKPL